MTVDGSLSDEYGKQYERRLRVALLKKKVEEDNPFVICICFDNVSTYKTGVFRKITLEAKE